MKRAADDGLKVFHFEDGSVLCEECARDDGWMPTLANGLRDFWVRFDGLCDSCEVQR
jgi:hypothetical protein